MDRIELDAAVDAAGLVGGMRVEPEPRNGPTTMSPRLTRSRRPCHVAKSLRSFWWPGRPNG